MGVNGTGPPGRRCRRARADVVCVVARRRPCRWQREQPRGTEEVEPCTERHARRWGMRTAPPVWQQGAGLSPGRRHDGPPEEWQRDGDDAARGAEYREYDARE